MIVEVSTESGKGNGSVSINDLRPILEKAGEFWTVEFDNDSEEFVQWSSEGYLEHWKDGRMFDRTNVIDSSSAIEKLYVDFLETDSGEKEAEKWPIEEMNLQVEGLDLLIGKYKDFVRNFDEKYIKVELPDMGDHFIYLDNHQDEGLPHLIFEVGGLSKFNGKIAVGGIESSKHLSPKLSLSTSSYEFHQNPWYQGLDRTLWESGFPYGYEYVRTQMLKHISILDLSKISNLEETAQNKIEEKKRKKGFFSKLLGGNWGSVEWYENWLSKLNKKYSAFDNAMKTLEGYIADIATLISDDYDPDYGPIHIQVYDDMEIGIIPPDPSNVVGVGQTRRGSQTYNDTASDVGDSGSDLGDTMSGDDGGE